MESIRTCVACRDTGERGGEHLLRFVRALDGEICFDEKAKAEGRGAWVCANNSCLQRAFLKRLLFRNQKTLTVKPEAMIATVVSRLKKSVLARLGILRRSGQIQCGRDPVVEQATFGQVSLVVFAKDLAPRSRRDVERDLLKSGAGMSLVDSSLSMADLGNCLGRRPTGVVAVPKCRISKDVELHLGMLSKIEQ